LAPDPAPSSSKKKKKQKKKMTKMVWSCSTWDLLVRLDAPDWNERLRLPERFARDTLRDMPCGARLHHPGGRRHWHFTAEGPALGVLVLALGYRSFVEENGLCRGYSLRLCYRGEANFSVSIWDNSGLRVDVPSFLLDW
jgi:hypothetical protein